MSQVAQFHGLVHIDRGPILGVRGVTGALGRLLLSAAALKAFAPTDSALVEAAYQISRRIVIAMLAAALIRGGHARFVWLSLLAMFSLFAAFSLYRELQPAEWVGQLFPLLEHISSSEGLSRGEWVVLLYHHDCPKCRKAIPQYEALAAQLMVSDRKMRVLLVEVPRHGDKNTYGRDRVRYAKLSDPRDWFVQAPVEVRLVEGTVTDASLELPSISKF